ncbi:hypothetical protein [Pedobacter sp. MC2016-24]|uniref:hypothetical protein n=1 Tax=Pedobacter sp. MC2016-24 TaxID=2780090 RepID=UPI00187E5EBA|nr:hypothetical protein [Pedobacter sp. MC2016-24]MBE9602787.1 hypothetical protein [Pedobacter sp. MC2016-24]
MKRTQITVALCICILTLSSVVKAQNLQTYSGAYRVGLGLGGLGKATYSYYTNKSNSNRVKHGAFSYVLNERNDIAGTFSKKASGFFKNGNKDGIWNYSLNYLDYARADFSDLVNVTGQVTLTASYLNGLPNGIWKYRKVLSNRDKRYFFGKLIVGPYQPFRDIEVSISFKDGKFAGPIKIKTSTRTITGNFDTNGYCDGQWVVNTDVNQETTDYKHGLVINRVNRSMPNGEILEKEVDDEALKSLKINFASGKIDLSELKNAGYTTNETNVFSNKLLDFKETIFNNTDFMYSTILGDKLIEREGDGISVQYNGGYMRRLKPFEFINLKSEQDYIDAEHSFQANNFDRAKLLYEKVLKEHENVVRPIELTDINSKLEKIDSIEISKVRNEKLASLTYLPWDPKTGFTLSDTNSEIFMKKMYGNYNSESKNSTFQCKDLTILKAFSLTETSYFSSKVVCMGTANVKNENLLYVLLAVAPTNGEDDRFGDAPKMMLFTFQKEIDHYNLKDYVFSPLDYIGFEAKLVNIGTGIGFLVTTSDYGHGEGTYSYEIFCYDCNSLSKVLNIVDFAGDNSGNYGKLGRYEYDSKLKFINTGKAFYDIHVSKTGTIMRNKKIVTINQSSTYSYKNGKYIKSIQ